MTRPGIEPRSPGPLANTLIGQCPVSIFTYKLVTIVEGNLKAPFSIATTPRCRGGRYSFPGTVLYRNTRNQLTVSKYNCLCWVAFCR